MKTTAVVVYPPHLEQEEMIGCSMHSKQILSTKVFILRTDKTILWLKQKLEAGPKTKQGFYNSQERCPRRHRTLVQKERYQLLHFAKGLALFLSNNAVIQDHPIS